MTKTITCMVGTLLAGLLPTMVMGQDIAAISAKYKALECASPTVGTTWAILDRDGANRPAEPYLSSLGQGEGGTGMVTSPPFVIAGDAITFTIRGHDGQTGERGENYIALVDARKGKTLIKTMAPGDDASKERSWDVSKLEGMEVRIEVHDGNSGGAFGWLGVGQIDASPAMKVDFRKGIPEGWERPQRKADVRYELLAAGVPFERNANVFTLIPKSGSVELPCGFAAERLFFLGCTVSGGKPLATCGGIEIHYRSGSPDVFPLICGFTLDGRHKLLSPSKAIFHASADPYQHYLVIEPGDEVIEKIRLVAQPDRAPIPRITAITCETTAKNERLMSLPASTPSAEKAARISSHGISADSPKLGPIMEEIRAAHNMPSAAAASKVSFRKHTLDRAFRSEGVALADFNGDGRLDIAAGNVYYAGPDWKMIPMFEEPQEFNRDGYSDAFLCFDEDVNHNGATDLIAVGFPGRQTHWLENPGKSGGVWKKHLAIAQTGNESPLYVDVDRDGRRTALCQWWQMCVGPAGERPNAALGHSCHFGPRRTGSRSWPGCGRRQP